MRTTINDADMPLMQKSVCTKNILLLSICLIWSLASSALAATSNTEEVVSTNPFAGSQYSESLLSPGDKQKLHSIKLESIPQELMIPIGEAHKLSPIQLEASYNRTVDLREVLLCALEQNLAIKISKAGLDSQRSLFYGSLARFLPDYTTTFSERKTYLSNSPDFSMQTYNNTVRFPLFQGGRVLFGSLANYHRMKGSKFLYSATINNNLLDVYKKYNEVVLQKALLQIRLKSMETSRAQLKLTRQQLAAGTGTKFAVMQSTTQLALDRQALVQQEVAVRQAALQLALVLNADVSANLIPDDTSVEEVVLINPTLDITALTKIALERRPELKEYNQTRLAAARQIQVAGSQLLPTFQLFLSANNTSVSGAGASFGMGGLGGLSATGSVPGTAASSVVIPAGTSPGGSSIGVGGVLGQSVAAGFDLSWNLPSMGMAELGNIASTRALARQALLQYNQQVTTVMQQVRSSYLNALTAIEQVDISAESVVAAKEGLRLADLRLRHGTGTNLELIQAQRDFVTALTIQAQAIIGSKNSQAQLLHDTALISLETLTEGSSRSLVLKEP